MHRQGFYKGVIFFKAHNKCNVVKDPGTALMTTKPIQVYTNENRL